MERNGPTMKAQNKRVAADNFLLRGNRGSTGTGAGGESLSDFHGRYITHAIAIT
jgi:hypothetical protein